MVALFGCSPRKGLSARRASGHPYRLPIIAAGNPTSGGKSADCYSPR